MNGVDTMIGPNTICECGSGDKFKKCHGNDEKYREMVYALPFNHEKKQNIFDTFFAVNADFKKYPNPGACHLVSSVLYILLQEQEINCDLCIGEVRNTYLSTTKAAFDHSWIEINEIPFDIAIQLTLMDEENPVVFAGYDLEPFAFPPTKFDYRAKQSGLDPYLAEKIAKQPLTQYLCNAPDDIHSWGAVERIGERLGIEIDRVSVMEKHKNTQRKIV